MNVRKQSFQSTTSSTFGLQSHNQIEQEFTKLTEKYRQQSQPQLNVNLHLSKVLSRQDSSEKKSLLRRELTLRRDVTNKLPTDSSNHDTTVISQSIEDQLTKQVRLCYQKSMNEVGHAKICKAFGTKLIGSLFEGLILFSVQKVMSKNRSYSAQDYQYLGAQEFIAEKNLIKQFDISKVKIDQQKKPEDKMSYILDSMKLNISYHMDNLNKQLLESHKQQNKFDLIYKQKIEEELDIQNKNSIFSEFQAIKGKLWQAIVSKLGEYENQIMCHKAIADGTKVTQLVNFQGVSTREIIRSEMAVVRKGNSFHRSELRKFEVNTKPQFQQSFDGTNQIWNNDLEDGYQQRYKNIKKMNHLDNRDTTHVGLQENIYNKIKQDDGKMEREVLFKKYIEEGLTADEVKFLNDTCDLINKNMDKEFEKKKLKALDQQLINQIELKVVQELLQRFVMLRQEFMKARKNFIVKKKETTFQKIRKFDLRALEVQALKLRKQETLRNKDLFYHKVQNMTIQRKFENPNVRIYVKLFIEGLKSSVRNSQQLRSELEGIKFLRKDQIDQHNKSVYDQIYKKAKFLPSKSAEKVVNWDKYFIKKKLRHAKSTSVEQRLRKANFHPPSKLVVFNFNDHKEDLWAAKKEFADQFMQNKLLEITYDQDQRFKQKSKFVSFYTGGPKEQPTQVTNMDYLNKCATLIQKVFRSYMTRKAFKNQLNKREEELKEGVHKIISNMRKARWDDMSYRLKSKTFYSRKNIQKRKDLSQMMETKIHFHNDHQIINSSYKVQTQSSIKTKNTDTYSPEKKQVTEVPDSKSIRRFNQILEQSKVRQDALDKIKQDNLDKEQKKLDKSREKLTLSEKLRVLFKMAMVDKNEINYLNSNAFRVNRQEVNLLNKEGYSALYFACNRACYPVAKFIINELGGDVNQRCHSNDTPLHVAMRSYNQDLIMFLVQLPISDFNVINDQGLTPFGLCPESLLIELGIFQQVVVSVVDKGKQLFFDNNKLIRGITQKRFDSINTEALMFSHKRILHTKDELTKNNSVSFVQET